MFAVFVDEDDANWLPPAHGSDAKRLDESMPRATFAPLIGPEYDSFLFASVGDDPDGRRLSVLSAFARTDVDPWREAACLAKMSREKAIARLTAFISAIPDRPAANIPANAVASHLVALLPTSVGATPQAPSQLARILAPPNSSSSFGLALGAIALLLVLALIAFSQPKPGSPMDGKPAASTERPATPPLALGQ